ncbi:uncharacterized protein LOC111627551 [Centruroides sculpturatus]|uniref:uncharacterized protein LOC111627551 n=1 Tax=Centruroides sculpturatus TaxID=218467 RepID=UPI000C6C900C|nr:uncharacterized protein LOC111627551 [Centruroides sculpturatus]
MLLFAISIEPLLRFIDTHQVLRGHRLPTTRQFEIRYLSYADDITLILSTLESIDHITEILQEFSEASGTKINQNKSKGLWIGAWNNLHSNYGNFSWAKENLKILGVQVGKNIKYQWDTKIEKVRKASYKWSNQNLSILGKAKIANLMLLSPMWYLLYTQPLPKKVTQRGNRITATYIRSSKYEPIRRNTLYNSVENRGIGLKDISLKAFVYRINIIKNIHSHPAWACLAKANPQSNIPNIVVSSAKITDRSKPPAILQEVIRCYKVLKEHLSDEEILSSKPDELYNKLVDIYVLYLTNYTSSLLISIETLYMILYCKYRYILY